MQKTSNRTLGENKKTVYEERERGKVEGDINNDINVKREGERDKDRQTDRDRETDRNRETEKETETERQTQ